MKLNRKRTAQRSEWHFDETDRPFHEHPELPRRARILVKVAYLRLLVALRRLIRVCTQLMQAVVKWIHTAGWSARVVRLIVLVLLAVASDEA